MKTLHYCFDDNRSVILEGYLCEPIEGMEKTFKRPAVLVIPGGGYNRISRREGEPIALKFLSKGFNAFVLSYPVKTLMPETLRACAWAIGVIRRYHENTFTDPERISVCGFSAGGHLAGMISTLQENEVSLNFGDISLIPNACVLCYPVIDGGQYEHKDSFDNICKDAFKHEEFSVQSRVTKNTPPTFIWSTATDATVPVQNSILMAKSLADNNIPFELHIFDEGIHGLATCEWQTADNPNGLNPSCSKWFELSIKFLEKYMG